MGFWDTKKTSQGGSNGVFDSVWESYNAKQKGKQSQELGDSFGYPALGKTANSTAPIDLSPQYNTLQSFKETGKLLKHVGQSIMGSFGSAALSLSKPMPGDVAQSFKSSDLEGSPFIQSLFENLFGKETELKSVEQRVAEAEIKLKDWGAEVAKLKDAPNLTRTERSIVDVLSSVAQENPEALSFLGVMGTVGLDITPFGGIRKNVVGSFKRAKTEADALFLLNKLGVSEDLAKKFASDVVKVTTDKDAELLFHKVANIQDKTVNVTKAVSDEVPLKTGKIEVKDYVKPPEVKIKSGDIPVKRVADGGYVPIQDARYTKNGDIFVQGVRYAPAKNVPIQDATYPKAGDIFVKGFLYEPAKNIPIKDVTYPRSGTIEVTDDFKEAIPFDKRVVDPVPAIVSDIPATPVANDLGVMTIKIQEDLGQAVVTTKNASKFAQAEKEVMNSIDGFAQDSAEVAARGGKESEVMVKVPAWVPEGLRDPVLFGKVVTMIKKGDIPTVHGSPEMNLYNEMRSEIARRGGALKKGQSMPVDGSSAIAQSYTERSTPIGSIPKVSVSQTGKVNAPEGVDYSKDFKGDAEAAQADFRAHEMARNEQNRAGDKVVDSGISSLDFNGVTDIGRGEFRIKDIFRVSKKVFGEQWETVKKVVFDGFDDAKMKMVGEEKKYTDGLYNDVVKGLGIKKGSKESYAVVEYGEGKIDRARLVADFGEAGADKVVAADAWFRNKYDTMIAEINAVKAQIYPNQPWRLITPRQRYYRHSSEMSMGAEGLRNLFEGTGLGNLEKNKIKEMTESASLTADDGKMATQKWHSIEQQRKGDQNAFDAVTGFIDYLPQFSFAKHIDPQIGRMIQFNRSLEKAAGGKLDNYVAGLVDWTNDLAGKANFIDRFLVKNGGEGARKIINVLDWMNKRAKRDAILANFSTAGSQIFNVPFGIASAGPIHSTQGLVRSMGDVAHTVFRTGEYKAAWQQSSFIAERYKNSMYDKFDVNMLEKAESFGGWMISVLDEVGTKFVWNAHYEKALREGNANPVRFADDMTRRAVAGRGVGEVPLVQKSKVFQMIAPFQIEIANGLFNMGEHISKKEVGALATLFVSMYALNKASEMIKGQDVGMDPIQAIYDSYQIAMLETPLEEGEEKTWTDTKTARIGGRLVGEIVSNVPLGNYMVAGVAGRMGWDKTQRQEFFGKEGDPVRYGTAPLLWNALDWTGPEDTWMTPLFRMGPKWGGRQLEKTVGGIGALADGEVLSKDGTPIMDVKPGVSGAVQNILFGKWQPNFHYEGVIEREMTALYKENEVLLNSGVETDKELALKNVQDLTPEMGKVYVKVRGEQNIEKVKKLKNDMRPLVRTLDALKSEGKKEEALKILRSLSERDVRILESIRVDEAAEEKAMDLEDAVTPETAIKEALDYAYAYATNPIQAYKIQFVNHEHIRDTVGGSYTGMVRTRRISRSESDKIKEAMGDDLEDDNKLYLEHKLPVGLNGSNLLNNLALVSEEQHNSSTAMETYLVNAVKTEKIDYKVAAALILRYKGYEGEPITADEIKAIVGVESFPKNLGDSQHRGVDDWFRNSWPLSDEDNTERNNHRLRFGDMFNGRENKTGSEAEE